MAELRALTWNVYHGRDDPPDRSLHTWRSKLLGLEETGSTHVQLNRELLVEFATMICGTPWDVALLQEFPPRWHQRVATACEADSHAALTSRNQLGRLRSALARRNPDLLGSWEGGSNLTLVRNDGAGGGIVERREVELTRRPERRVMALTRLASGHCVANLHASTSRERAEREVAQAAAAVVEWAGGSPLIFGGDLNLRPRSSPELFARLDDRHGLAAPTAPDAIDHLLAGGLSVLSPPSQWPVERRELGLDDLVVRLSDHAPVEASFESP